MWESSYPFFAWHDQSWLGQTVSGSTWLFPAIETIHILAMAIMFGGLLVINLRLLGLGVRGQPVTSLATTLMPFVNWGLIVMLLSGYGMFCSEAIKCFTNDGFKFKMAALLAVVLFQVTIYKWMVGRSENERSAVAGAGVAAASFVLWFLVGAAGRAIGFV
jgi:hypothetical protein